MIDKISEKSNNLSLKSKLSVKAHKKSLYWSDPSSFWMLFVDTHYMLIQNIFTEKTFVT